MTKHIPEEPLEPIASNEPISPSAISTPKEAQQDDTIRVLQQQIAELTQAVGQLSKKTKTATIMSKRSGDSFGFLRTYDGIPMVGWMTKPGSYAALNSFGAEVDEQYIKAQLLNGDWTDYMQYQKFDQQTKINQVPVKIPDYCEKNDVGEWKPKRHKPMDLIKVILSDDNGLTYEGAEIEVPIYALN